MTDDHTSATNALQSDAASKAKSVASDIKSAVSNTYDQTVTEARARADDAKAEVATGMGNMANALRHASEEFRGGSAQERTLGQIANSIADASDAIRDKDLGEIVQMASDMGRRHPALFLGGAALLGFVASRYAKASAEGAASKAHKAPDRVREVESFVAEGNPNTQPYGTTP